MQKSSYIGKFYQGQAISIVISPSETETEEVSQMLTQNDLYIGIYGQNIKEKHILSTVDGKVVRSIAETGKVSLACVLLATDTKIMAGNYTVEMLVKNSDNTFTSPCDNVITFDVERRRISEVI